MTAVTVESIASGGDGVCRLPDGIVVFVPRTAPGDIVEIDAADRRRRFARGRLIALRQPGPDRAEPACPHYRDDDCGGCQLQHLTPAAQRRAKATMVGDALRRIAKLDHPDPPIAAPDAEWRYRSKITLAVRDLRSGERIAGFHRADEPGRLFALDDCRIAREPLMDLWRRVRPHLALLPARTTHITLREDRDGGRHVVVRAGERAWDAQDLAAAVGAPDVAYWWQPRGGAARVVAGPLSGFPALSFVQSNAELAHRIRREAVEGLGLSEGQVVWDLYGGVGETARLAASTGARVWSVDADRAAVEWAAGQGDEGIEYVHGLVEAVVARLPAPGGIVVNPPRVGLAAPAAAAIDRAAGGGATHLAYISCDPATLARDLVRMPGWRPVATRAFDLFPHTAHVETLVLAEAVR